MKQLNLANKYQLSKVPFPVVAFFLSDRRGKGIFTFYVPIASGLQSYLVSGTVETSNDKLIGETFRIVIYPSVKTTKFRMPSLRCKACTFQVSTIFQSSFVAFQCDRQPKWVADQVM